ncbi:hypothetical protein Tco_0778077 [Tanacetum coccineum]
MHIRQLPSGFCTNTGFAIHVGYFTRLTIPAFNHSDTSFVTTCLFSSENTLRFWATGLSAGFLSCVDPSGERFVPIFTSCSGIVGACERTVVIPHRVGNFIIPCIVEGIALSCLRAGLPRMMVYGDGAGMTVNLIIARRQRPVPPKHTSSSIFPNGFTLSPENPDIVVCVSASLAFIFGWSILKQCSYMISTDAPSSMCILLTKYPSVSASITKASSEKSLAGTGGKDEAVIRVIPLFIMVVAEFMDVLFARYGYIKNHKKTIKNGQARTRESEEYKKKPTNQN